LVLPYRARGRRRLQAGDEGERRRFQGRGEADRDRLGGPAGSPVGRYASAEGDKPCDPLKAWREAQPDVLGTTVDAYLRGRGIELTPAEARSLRFHPALWYWPSQSRWPAMVALVALADGTELTAHMTFLDIDGSAKAPVERPRLFPKGGHTAGGGVWFGDACASHEFIVAEGVETLLSALRIFGATAGCAALSEGGIRRLVLPPSARRVRIFADNDELGQGVAAAAEAARRWRAEGRTAAVSMAIEAGMDANDVWLARRSRSSQEA
jgi:hypothetical protein